MVWLTLAWKFLRGIPREVWVLLAFLAAVAFAVGYHQNAKRQEFKRGEAARQVLWDAAIARGREEIARLDRENAAAEAKAFADGQAIEDSRVRDKDDIIAGKDRLIADLGTSNRKLRDLWQGCLSGPQAGDAADLSGGPVRADELRREIAEEISEGFDADSKITRLIQFQDVLRQQCKAVQ